MSEIRLKPCPFCGGKAEFVRKSVKVNGGYTDAVYVRCRACDARTNRVFYSKKLYPNDEEYGEAAEAWNTRKPMDQIVEQLENIKSKINAPADTVWNNAVKMCTEIVQEGGAE